MLTSHIRFLYLNLHRKYHEIPLQGVAVTRVICLQCESAVGTFLHEQFQH